MDPRQEIQELREQVERLQRQLEAYTNISQIDPNSTTALRLIKTSSKSATSENQAVNESGSASYNVLKAPDAFLSVTINSQEYSIPAFT